MHPAKIEVKFAEERRIFDLVYYGVRSALEGEAKPVEAQLSPSTRKVVEPRADFYRSMSAESFRQQSPAAPIKKEPPAPSIRPPKPASPPPPSTPQRAVFSDVMQLHSPSEQLRISLDPVPAKAPPSPPPAQEIVDKSVENVESFQDVEISPIAPYKMVGEALKTYVLVEQEDALILIDKHAAHERMIFDRLKSQERQILSQSLLSPIPLPLSGEDAGLLESCLPLLGELGFEIDEFGENTVLLRQIPMDLDSSQVTDTLETLASCVITKAGRLSHRPLFLIMVCLCFAMRAMMILQVCLRWKSMPRPVPHPTDFPLKRSALR